MSNIFTRRKWKQEPLVVFVEGYSDLCFYAELLERVGFAQGQYYIHDLGGKDRGNLISAARLLLKPDNLEHIRHVVVVYDSDGNADASFASAQGSLREATGVVIPSPSIGTQHNQVSYSILIAGTQPGQGEIESLACAALAEKPAQTQLLDCVRGYLDCLSSRRIPLRSPDKVRLGAALAVLHEDDPRLGPAARAGVFDLEAACFQPFAQHLHEILKSLGTQVLRSPIHS